MSGIVGYIGQKNATPLLVAGLKRLEYIGCDSAGVAIIEKNAIGVVKTVGKLKNLEKKLKEYSPQGQIGIGHTRWATHGRPSDANSHPHKGCSDEFAVVHNGIIENYLELRAWLIFERGHLFKSETDTEVIAHLVEEYYQGDFADAVRRTLNKVNGSYAIGVISTHEPDKLIAARKNSPLIVGLGKGENFIASDLPALLTHTREVIFLEDEEIAVLTGRQITIYNGQNVLVERPASHVDWEADSAEKGGFEHFMLKEICEQPEALKKALNGRVQQGKVNFEELHFSKEQVDKWNKIYLVGSGSSYHAGLIGKTLLDEFLQIPAGAEIASEFCYREPNIDENTLVILISQSGETTDTLVALREANRKGAATIALTNAVGSTISREAHYTVYLWAGPEVAVASTKTYTTMLIVQYLLGLYLARLKGTMTDEKAGSILSSLQELPHKTQQILDKKEEYFKIAESIKNAADLFLIGRGYDYGVAEEGALKLKEVSYLHAEAYAAGELKHGTLALITKDTPVIALVLQKKTYEKTLNSIKELITRDAYVIGVAMQGDTEILKSVNKTIFVPASEDIVSPVLAIVPLQLLAYYMAVIRGCNVDQPRNLAKSIKVE